MTMRHSQAASHAQPLSAQVRGHGAPQCSHSGLSLAAPHWTAGDNGGAYVWGAGPMCNSAPHLKVVAIPVSIILNGPHQQQVVVGCCNLGLEGVPV